MSTSTNDALAGRIRAEYLEMPGMTLRLEQVARLCGIDRTVCKVVLDALVEAKFLCLKDDGAYTRFSADMIHHPRTVKASLDSSDRSHVRLRAS